MGEAQKTKRRAEITLENLMNEKSLVQVNGTLQPKKHISNTLR